jgi:predicted exporter
MEIPVASSPGLRWALVAWLAFLAVCAAIVARTTVTTDVSAFLPRSPTPAQEVLVEQLREGVVSRLILIGLEGAPTEALAGASRRIAQTLRNDDRFLSVSNGEDVGTARDRDYLWRNRYLLSPGIEADRFSAKGLRARLEENLALLNSPVGMLVRRTLPADPTGELLQIVEQLQGQSRPQSRDGVWFSRDGSRALMVAQTRAAGFDIDAQERALAAIRAAHAQAANGGETRLSMSGPGVFSVQSRAAIKGDVIRLSLIATILISVMTLAFYRSPRVLALSFLPVASGAVAGVAAVSLGFGSVHGITLGFGVTLIGEGVDYAIYLFTQVTKGVAPYRTLDRIWPTLRLGMLTSICGFSAMLFSGFNGLAQLGLFSIVGLAVAVAVTRWVLPGLMPAGFTVAAAAAWAPAVLTTLRHASRVRVPLLIAVACAAVLLWLQRDDMWDDQLISLTPIPRAAQLLDQRLRTDLGAPDTRYLVIVKARDEEGALRASETVADALRIAMKKGRLAGFDGPAAYLPSRWEQEVRQTALPVPAELRANLQKALVGLPYRPGTFEAFLKDVEAARVGPLLDRSKLGSTQLALKVDSLLARRDDGWVAMMPLRGVADAPALGRMLTVLPGTQALLLDLRGESEQLYGDYRREALWYSLAGAAAIVGLLFLGLRSARRVVAVLAPLVAAVIITTAALRAGGTLSIFHLVGLLLVVAAGSNYSLFFDREAVSAPDRGRTVVSLMFACLSTVLAFGLLAFSSVPVLKAIGTTVGIGAALALLFSAILSREPSADERHP